MMDVRENGLFINRLQEQGYYQGRILNLVYGSS